MPTLHQQANFLDLPAIKKLTELARHPFDLAAEGNLTPQRLAAFVAEGPAYKMLYGTERVTDDVMHHLVDLSEQAHVMQKMHQMQDGQVMNYITGFPCENRAVLHTATRDFFDHPNTAKEASNAAKQCKKEIDKLKAFMDTIDKENHFTDLVSIGIGGSDLGPRAHYIALEYLLKKGRKVHFISNVDPDDAAMVMKGLDLKKRSSLWSRRQARH